MKAADSLEYFRQVLHFGVPVDGADSGNRGSCPAQKAVTDVQLPRAAPAVRVYAAAVHWSSNSCTLPDTESRNSCAETLHIS